jgi:hypothetical protein
MTKSPVKFRFGNSRQVEKEGNVSSNPGLGGGTMGQEQIPKGRAKLRTSDRLVKKECGRCAWISRRLIPRACRKIILRYALHIGLPEELGQHPGHLFNLIRIKPADLRIGAEPGKLALGVAPGVPGEPRQ